MSTVHSPATPDAAGIDWARLQAFSGLTFAIFLTVHLATTFAAVLGPEAFTAVQRAGRVAYQFPILEIGMLLAIAVHIVAGVKRWRPLGAGADRKRRLHRWAGVFLAVIIVEHFMGTRGVTLISGADTGFSAVSFTLHYLPEWFAPYYLVLGTAGLFHAWYGSLTALTTLGWVPAMRVRASAGFWVLPILGCATLALALAGFRGLLYEVGDPFDSDYARFYLQVLGVEAPVAD